ncbi:MAG: hypothetical protein IJT24_08220 [Lachnospiraceae bacterium]|nr:hypothetical protein [Lachnospiraceae bacterium]
MTRQEAEDYIYASYMRALPFLSYDMPDSEKRHPGYTEGIIKKHYAGTPSVAVTGSKGKGSVAYILSRILSLYGKTGLMTGPHIESFNERFRAGDSVIGDDEFAGIISSLTPELESIKCDPGKGEFISPIGIETAAAEVFFLRHHTDYDIYEHGKGVRYDDVKNVPASYGIINTIFLEHTRELGGTLKDIARDKACIIRPGMKGIYAGWQSDEVRDIITEMARENKVPLKLAGRDFDVSDIVFHDMGMSCTVTTGRRSYSSLGISLMGSAQCRNLALALAAAEDIAGEGFCASDEDMEGLRKVLSELSWFGRLSVLSRDPFVLADCCINRASAAGALEVLKELGIYKALFILAIPDDKDYLGVAQAVAREGHDIVLTRISNAHYRFTGVQTERLREAGISCGYAEDITEAIGQAEGPAAILGTTAMLPAVKSYFDRRSI